MRPGPGGPRRLPRGPPTALPSSTPAANLSRAFDLAGRRDSDASSLCGSLPSSAGGRPSLILSDRSSQASALSFVNSALADLRAGFSLRPPLPSAKEVTSALRFLLACLDFEVHPSEKALEEELPVFLKLLRCPCKLNKSALKAPGTPHAWPAILSVLFWLTELVQVQVHAQADQSEPSFQLTDLESYISTSYSHFLSGNDSAVEALDDEYCQKVGAHSKSSKEHVEALEREFADLEARLAVLTHGPSPREELENKKALLIEDQKKFEAVVQRWTERVREMEETMANLQAELGEKEREIQRRVKENNELERRVGEQGVNVTDVERMRREMQALERDFEEAVRRKSELDERVRETEDGIGKVLEQMEVLVWDCNQALKKLKLEVDFQYVLNKDGSSPAEVIGQNYKTTLKPALKALDEDFKKSVVSKLDESNSLRSELEENSKLLEEKKRNFTNLQDKLREIESKADLVKNELEEYRTKLVLETEKLNAEFNQKENELTLVENEAQEYLKMSEMKRMNAIKETEEEIQMCISPLLCLIDSVSEYMEFMESTVENHKSDLSELIADVAAMSTTLVSSSSVLGVKRARFTQN